MLRPILFMLLARVFFPSSTNFGELFNLVVTTAKKHPDSIMYQEMMESFLFFSENLNVDFKTPLNSVVSQAKEEWKKQYNEFWGRLKQSSSLVEPLRIY